MKVYLIAARFIDEMKPPEMSKFIEQVAALEGVSFDGGTSFRSFFQYCLLPIVADLFSFGASTEDKALVNESGKETPRIEETSSRF